MGTADIIIVGGGPAGLVTALEARGRGLGVTLFERHRGAVDKACGEGLMPAGLAALQRLGVELPAAESSAFAYLTYVDDAGRRLRGRLPPPGGLGVRRVALSDALRARARAAGVTILEGVTVRSHRLAPESVSVSTDQGEWRARVLVAADGLHSRLRKDEGLEAPARGVKRYGLRRHLRLAPWDSSVEVHFAPGLEAYVTPAGTQRVGVAFLWRDGVLEKPSFEALLARVPFLAKRLEGAAYDSEARGAGPLLQRVKARTKPRFALVGDAAGYVDAITGEGLTLAFECAHALAKVLPAMAEGDASARHAYEQVSARLFSRYARLANCLLQVAARPTIRRALFSLLSRSPKAFESALRFAVAPQ